jgi:hypothetical protein
MRMRNPTVLMLSLAWAMVSILPDPAASAETSPVKAMAPAKTLKSKSVAKEKSPSDPMAPATSPEKAPAPKAAEPLGDGFISLGVLHISLNRPASVTLHNAGGQLLFHLDSFRSSEILPLQGINAGFLYLTLRAGKSEITKKLVYTGK